MNQTAVEVNNRRTLVEALKKPISSIDSKDDYIWNDFYAEHHNKTFIDVNDMLINITPNLCKVLANVLQGSGFCFKKDSTGKEILTRVKYNDLNNIIFKYGILAFDPETDGYMTVKHKKITLQKYLIEYSEYVPTYGLFKFIPTKIGKVIDKRIFNTWTGYNCKLIDNYDMNLVQPFLDYTWEIITRGGDIDKYEGCEKEKFIQQVQKNYNRLLTWLHYHFIHPDMKTKKALILYSLKKQVGKNIWVDVIKAMTGERLTFQTTKGIGDITGNFNGKLLDNKLAVLNELPSTAEKFRALFDELKGLITDIDTSIRLLYHESFQSNNYSNFIAISNHNNCFSLEQGCTRYALFEVSACRKGQFSFFKDFVNNYVDSNIAYDHIFSFLYNYVPTEEIFDVWDSELRDLAIDNSRSSPSKFLLYLYNEYIKYKDVSDDNVNKIPTKITGMEIYRLYGEWAKKNNESILKQRSFGTDLTGKIKKEKGTGNKTYYYMDTINFDVV